MEIFTRNKKWLKRLLVLVIIIIATGSGLLYVINYRLRDILQIVVNKESKGIYGFDADAIEISLLHRNVIIKNADLFCRDTANTSPHYDVKIPEVYLSIQSWQDVIFHKKVSVDSLAVFEPEIRSHEHFAQKGKPASFHAPDITKNIEKLLKQLQVRSFHIQDASFVFSRLGNPVSLSGNHISFSISNFAKKENDSGRLFSADDIDLSMGAQHWILPDGKHEVKFTSLHFSGKDQFFRLDSFNFHAFPLAEKGEMNFSAEKLFFNSKQLTALYEQDALLIDTLICFRPVLNVETTDKTIKADSSSNVSVSQSVGQLFDKINIKYIDVTDGELSIINRYRPNYVTQKANLKAYNLQITKDGKPPITTDSIKLNLKNLVFLTTDSLFQMTVEEFALNNNDVIFRNAVYSPTARNHADKGFTFTTPSLHLKNINLAALMNKKLVADTAELNRPVITVFDKRKNKAKDSMVAKTKATPTKKKSFYQTLHGLSELIAVQHFNILNGSLGYTASGDRPMKLTMKNLNASILLDRLFLSDSLIDIKRSLPEVSAGTLTVQSPKANIKISNYVFNGDRRHNHADKFQLSLSNGTTINAGQLYWEVLDWDMYTNHKIIQIDYLKLHDLAISIRKKEQSTESQVQNKKDLPVLNIARFNLDVLDFDDSSAKSRVRFNAKDICVDNIGSNKQFLTWNNAEGLFSNLSFKSGIDAKTISVSKISFNTQSETVLQQAKVDIGNEKGHTRVDLPLAKIKTNIHSTDFSAIHIISLEADNANIDIYKKQAAEKTEGSSKSIAIPVTLRAEKLLIKKASVKYTAETTKDTLTLTAGLSIDATEVFTFKKQNNLFNYDKMLIGLQDVKIDKGNLNLAIQQSSLALSNGVAEKNDAGKMMLHAGLLVKWVDADMNLKQTDTTGIEAHGLAGSFDDPSFQVYPKMKLKWQSLLNKAAITKGAGIYKGKNITVSTGSIAWNPAADMLSLHSFSVLPNLSMKETFAKPGAWQGDYMTVKGESMDITGIRFHQKEGDSSLTVKKIVLDSMSLVTIRDKRMPFKHGVEKPMPVVMISKIKMPLSVDSVVVKHSKVTVNEIAVKSEKQGTVPLSDINAVITNLKNYGNTNDTLRIAANAHLLNYKISDFYYKEAYGDSLSYFFADVHVSPMALHEFSTVTIPMASIGVDNGNADTLFAHWVGNKYAAVGRMDFYYKGLKIRLLDAKDNSKKRLILSLGNKIAGLILRKNNDETSRMFFLRDREKFIFNYWVKTVLAGISTSAGIKRNKKMLKQYKDMKTQYSLPVLYD